MRVTDYHDAISLSLTIKEPTGSDTLRTAPRPSPRLPPRSRLKGTGCARPCVVLCLSRRQLPVDPAEAVALPTCTLEAAVIVTSAGVVDPATGITNTAYETAIATTARGRNIFPPGGLLAEYSPPLCPSIGIRFCPGF